MSKKITTVLAGVAALLLLAAIPMAAFATTAQAPAGTALFKGAPIKAFSENLTFELNSGPGIDVQCKESILEGELTNAGHGTPDHLTIQFKEGSFTEKGGGSCAVDGVGGGVTMDFISNLQKKGAGKHWDMQIQQPDPDTKVIIAHLSASPIQFELQVQADKTLDAGTCHYEVNELQLTGKEGSNTFTITKAAFTGGGTLTSCGNGGSLTGDLRLSSGGNNLAVDMN